MILDLTISEAPGGVRFDAPGLSFRDLIPILRGSCAGFQIRFLAMEDFRGSWPPEGSVSRDGVTDMGLDEFMDQAEAVMIEGSGPLFRRMVAILHPDKLPPPAPAEFLTSENGPGPSLPVPPAGGMAFASEEDFLAAILIPEEESLSLFRALFRAVFQDHPAVARGLSDLDAERLLGLARRNEGIHFNPEKWRPDPEGKVSLANLGTEFHFPCHHPPIEGKVSVVRLTSTEDGVGVSEPFGIEVNDYLDRWYDRPVGCRKFIRAAIYGGILILVLLLILFWSRRG